MFITILSFVFVFTIITLVHEGGHLFFSKLAGIRVPEFGIGFGPRIFSFSRNNTTYCLNLFPILGYVKIAGIDTDDPSEASTPVSEKYFSKSVFHKFLSIASGALLNLFFGFLIFLFLFNIFGSPAGTSNQISTITPNSPAAKAGILPGDKIISINGQIFTKAEDAVSFIHQSADKPLSIKLDRKGSARTVSATPKLNKQLKIGLLGFSLNPMYKRSGFLTSFSLAVKQTAGLSFMLLTLLGKLFIGKLALGDLAGPVGIAQITGQYAQQGAVSFLNFLAFFSINVAVLNLLPLPALDGGRLVFILIELVFRRPVDIEVENKIHQVGMMVLLGLIALLTINDVFRLFRP